MRKPPALIHRYPNPRRPTPCLTPSPRALLFLMLLLCLPGLAWPEQTGSQNKDGRGVQLVIEDRAGKRVGGYDGSNALLIGVSDYTAGWPDLDSVPNELSTVAKTLKQQGFKVRQILNPDATSLEEAFRDFIDRYGYEQNRRLLFFFSGHGYTRKQSKGYLVPADAPDPRKDEKGFLKKALAMSQILEMARRIEAKHALFLFDSCFSGTVFKSKALPDIPRHITDLTVRPVRQFITAGSANEKVPAKSVFTPSLVRGLQGEADLSRDGYVTGTELGMYLHDKVLYYDTGQTPQYGKIRDPDLDEGDFVFRLPETANLEVPGSSPEIVYFTAPASTINVGQSATLSWRAENAEKVFLNKQPVKPREERTFSPNKTTTYELVAINEFGKTIRKFTISVAKALLPKITGFGADPPKITAGKASVLSWKTENGYEVFLNKERARGYGKLTVKPKKTTTYTLVAKNRAGLTDTKTLTIYVESEVGGASSHPYRIAILPFAGEFGNENEHKDIAGILQARIEEDSSLALASFSKKQLVNPDKLWVGKFPKKPDLQSVYATGRKLGVDGIVMCWGGYRELNPLIQDKVPTRVRVYIVDVHQEKVYYRKGLLGNARKIAKQVFADFAKSTVQ